MKSSRGRQSDHVANAVRAELARSGYSGVSAARELGWQQAYLSRRLTGQTSFSADDLIDIAALLELPVAIFFEDPGQRKAGVRRRGLGSRALASAA